MARSTVMRARQIRPTRNWLAFATIAFLCLPAHPDRNGMAAADETKMDEVLYTPNEKEVRAEYQRDLANQKVQTWREYWGWVQSFYKGNLLADGWTKYSQTTLEGVKGEDVRPTLLTKINRLGKLISQEWAKHDSVRKITTTDLKRWHDAITQARRNDDGSGHGIRKAMDEIHEQVQKQVGAREATSARSASS